MNHEDIRRLFPNASGSLFAANAEDPGQAPKLERPARDAALGASQGEETASGRVHIRFVSVRKRLLDPDNLSEKWLLDCLRYIGAIDGDEPEKITLETTQRKAAKGEEEHTEVSIFTITQPTDT